MKNYFLFIILLSITSYSQNEDTSNIVKNIDSVFFANEFTERKSYSVENEYSNYFNGRGSIDSNFYGYISQNKNSYVRFTIYTYNSEKEVLNIYNELKSTEEIVYEFGKRFSLLQFYKNKIYVIHANCYFNRETWFNLSEQLILKSIATKQLLNCYCGFTCEWEDPK